MLRRRTVLTAGLGLLGGCGPRPAPADAAPVDLVDVALADRAATLHDALPPSAGPSTPVLLVADLGSVRTWDASSLALHTSGRACLRRIRTAVAATIEPDVLARIQAHLAAFTGDARSRYTDRAHHGRSRTYHAGGKQIAVVGAPDHTPASIAALDAEVGQFVDTMNGTTVPAERLLVWHAREHLAAVGAFDDELWVFADGHLILRRADGNALPTFTTRLVPPAALAFLTVALTRPIAATDTLKPVALALGTGHKFVLASLERELAVQPNEPPPPGLDAVLRETLWLRRAFA